jgi:hypothetical protein
MLTNTEETGRSCGEKRGKDLSVPFIKLINKANNVVPQLRMLLFISFLVVFSSSKLKLQMPSSSHFTRMRGKRAKSAKFPNFLRLNFRNQTIFQQIQTC